MKIIIDGVIETLKTRQDGTITIAFSTQELDSSKAGELFSIRGKYCKAFFSDNNISQLEENLVDTTNLVVEKNNKTASQRLRAVLYRWHEQNNFGVEFDNFYKLEMEKIISHYKAKLQ